MRPIRFSVLPLALRHFFFKKMISSGNGGVGGQAVARQADNGRAGKQRTERGEPHPSGITTLELKLS